MIYLDTSYLVRLYLPEPGFEAVRTLVRHSALACGAFGQVEVVAALHRKWREGTLSAPGYRTFRTEFEKDRAADAVRWLPLSDSVIRRTQRAFDGLPPSVFLRAADALHLACAAEHGTLTVYSNDRHLLAAASFFGVQAWDVIGRP